MWQIALACAAAFAAAWAAAVVVAALGLWVPAVPLLAAAAAAWAAACALTAAWSRGRAWWAPAHTVGGVTVAVAASIAWFGALFSALLARDPAALASAALDGWSPYALAIDVARSGIGEVLPYSLGARVAVSAEQLVVWPTMLLLLAAFIAALGAPRRAAGRP